jgi:hypothetical protein
MQGYTKITAKTPSNIKLVASKTSDAYGLRLRFINKTPITKKTKTQESTTPIINNTTNTNTLPTKKGLEFGMRYYIVVSLLIIGIIIMLILKKKTQNTPLRTQKKDSWLFKPNNNTPATDTIQPAQQELNNNTVSILFQKQINETNSVVMLNFMNESYLVLMGNSNILLDKFHDNKPATQQEFETILQSRNQELEDFMLRNNTLENDTAPLTPKDPVQAYKERAATMAYNSEM